jgi:hypothetical protein
MYSKDKKHYSLQYLKFAPLRIEIIDIVERLDYQ